MAVSTHDSIKSISWLTGNWSAISAEGKYPKIKPFTYGETIEFESVGQPMLNYSSHTWNTVNKKPMHLERGFLRIKPGTNELAFIVAHNFGLTTIEEGFVTNNEVNLKSVNISRMSFAKDPAVTKIERVIKLGETTDLLEVITKMATTNTELTEHLRVVYKRN